MESHVSRSRCGPRRCRFAAFLFGAAALAQTQINVTTATDAALRNAFVQANQLAPQASATNPVVINLQLAAGTVITLSSTLPRLVVDHLTVQVQGAAPAQRVILDGPNTTGVLRFGSRNAVFRNLVFRRAGRNVPGVSDGVIGSGASDVLFQNCDFEDSTGIGLWLYGSPRVTVSDCGFRLNSGPGLRCLDGSDALQVVRCTFASNTGGLVLGAVGGVHVRDSTFDQNGDGVLVVPICKQLEFGPGNVVRRTGPAPGMTMAGAVDAQVHDNRFEDNVAGGLAVVDRCFATRVHNNVFVHNGAAGGAAQLTLANLVAVSLLGNSVQNGLADGALVTGCANVTVAASTAAATAITGNARVGMILVGCTDVVVRGLTLQGNLANGAPGAQLQVTDSYRLACTGLGVLTPGPGTGSIGIGVLRGAGLTIGDGTLVQGHGAVGIVVQNATDVVLGVRSPGSATGGLTVRNNGGGIQLVGCTATKVAGDPAVPATRCVLESCGGTMQIAVNLTTCRDCELGPELLLDTRRAAPANLQIDGQCSGVRVIGATVQGHVNSGVVVVNSSDVELRDCVVDGGATVPPAVGVGVDINAAGVGGVRLFGTQVKRHGSDGVRCTNSPNLLLGPGCHLFDNGGDAFVAQSVPPVAPLPVVVLQSASAVGRNGATQSGFRLLNVDARLCNVTATRHAFGLTLQGNTTAKVVNSIFHGNGVLDRQLTSTNTGNMSFSIHGTSLGTWTGTGNLVNTAANFPGFVSAATDDVRLNASSPAIDSGTHATLVGVTLPCTDREGAPRIANSVVDRGACEFVPAAGRRNALDLQGPWLRPWHQSQLEFRLDAGVANAGRGYLLLATGAGTGPGFALPGGGQLPLVGDAWTTLLLGAPASSTGTLDGFGRRKHMLAIPPDAVLALPPELTFCFTVTPAMSFVANPVVVRFLR